MFHRLCIQSVYKSISHFFSDLENKLRFVAEKTVISNDSSGHQNLFFGGNFPGEVVQWGS